MTQSSANPSPSKFPANREKNNVICKILAQRTIAVVNSCDGSRVYEAIPKQQNRDFSGLIREINSAFNGGSGNLRIVQRAPGRRPIFRTLVSLGPGRDLFSPQICR